MRPLRQRPCFVVKIAIAVIGVSAVSSAWAQSDAASTSRPGQPPGDATSGSAADTGPANCLSAITRQERLSKAAELKRMQRAAVTVTGATVTQAEDLAAKWWDAQGVAFLVDSARRGGDHIRRSVHEYDPRVHEVPQVTCRALAARDPAACRALPERESAGCLAWLALHGATTAPDGAGCASAPVPLRAACALITNPEAKCPAEPGPAQQACVRVRDARAGLAEACKLPDEETGCTWAALLTSLGVDRSVGCGALRPGQERRSPRARRTHKLCRAVVDAEPRRCPEDTVPVQVDEVATWFEARVLGGRTGLRLVTNLQVDRPAVCAIEVGLRRTTPAVTAPAGTDHVVEDAAVTETLRWTMSPGSRVGVPHWRDLETKGSPWELNPVAVATCVPRVRWSSP